VCSAMKVGLSVPNIPVPLKKSSSVVCDALAVEARKRAMTECFSNIIVKCWSYRYNL